MFRVLTLFVSFSLSCVSFRARFFASQNARLDTSSLRAVRARVYSFWTTTDDRRRLYVRPSKRRGLLLLLRARLSRNCFFRIEYQTSSTKTLFSIEREKEQPFYIYIYIQSNSSSSTSSGRRRRRRRILLRERERE